MPRYTNFPNGVRTFPRDSRTAEKSANYTVVADTDSGKTFITTKASVTYTLPAITIGQVHTIVNNAPDGSLLTISPNANDGISYLGSKTDNKDLINTAATAKKGDYVTLASLESTVAWSVVDIQGVWAKEA